MIILLASIGLQTGQLLNPQAADLTLVVTESGATAVLNKLKVDKRGWF
jgi:hypothetical protein